MAEHGDTLRRAQAAGLGLGVAPVVGGGRGSRPAPARVRRAGTPCGYAVRVRSVQPQPSPGMHGGTTADPGTREVLMAAVVEPGTARSPGITVSAAPRQRHPSGARGAAPGVATVPGRRDIPVQRFMSREWHEREVERLWQRVWQFACREEHMPHVGSYVVYDIVNLSFVVCARRPTRSRPTATPACTAAASSRTTTGGAPSCAARTTASPGSSTGPEAHPGPLGLPPHRCPPTARLPEAKVETWAGFVFINPDPDAGPLDGRSSAICRSTSSAGTSRIATSRATSTKIIPANWKVVQEAFSESFHAARPIRRRCPYLGDVNSQVDLWDNFSRIITPGGTASPLLRWEPTEEEILRYMLDIRVDEERLVPAAAGGRPPATAAAAVARERWRPIVGDQRRRVVRRRVHRQHRLHAVPQLPPVGRLQPHRLPVPSRRRRPPQRDHGGLPARPVHRRAPAAGRVHRLELDESWTDAPELGMFAKVFEQDSFNMPKVQKGLEATAKPGVTLGNYQESKVRWFHHLLANGWGADARDDPPGQPGAVRAGRSRPRAGRPRRTRSACSASDGRLDRRRDLRGRSAAVQLGRWPEVAPPPPPGRRRETTSPHDARSPGGIVRLGRPLRTSVRWASHCSGFVLRLWW